MWKRLLRRPGVLAFGARLVGAYLALVYATTRWRLIGIGHAAPLAARSQGAVVCFWHERLAMMPMLWRLARRDIPGVSGREAHVLLSRSGDGRLIGDTLGRFDLRVVLGSSSRGGGAAMVSMLRLLEEGALVAITPDGPRGPRRQAAPGAAQLAAASGLPVVPAAAATSPHLRLRSWDRLMFPLPFGRGVVVLGPPILIAAEAPTKAAQAAIAEALTACCEAADLALGLRPS